ncbi:MAG: glycosyltransferase, partial [Bacilli bacterium]|nr:glycosyltransferase [Bacilli bacterium]
ARVNGKEVKIEKVDNGFMAIKINKGKNNIEFKYTTPGLLIGIIISTISLVFYIIYLIKNKLTKEKSQYKKIIFFAYDLNVGGIEKALINLLNELVNEYEITLVLEKNEGTLKPFLTKEVKIIEHKVSTLKITILRKAINYTRRLIFTLKHKNKYDFSCAYATYLYSAVKLSLISSQNNSIYVHSDYANLYNEKDFKNFFNTRFINKFRTIIFVSNQSEENFIKYYPNLKEKTKVINNIVNYLDIINKSKEPINIKKEKDDITFAFVGRLEEESKKISRLLECFNILIKNNKNIKLWIIGDGTEYKTAENYIEQNNLKENIKLLGMHTNPYKYMQQVNYIILTSDYEGFPVIYNEAAILGKPVFSTLDISDDYYEIEKGHGFIIPKDPYLMANKITEIIKTKPKVETTNFKELNKIRLNELKKIIEEK